MYKFIIAIFSLFLFTAVQAMEPQNIYYKKQSLIKYHDSGEYNRDIEKVTANAKRYLANRIKNNTSGKKLAIVFDIDDTMISTYDGKVLIDFGGNLKDIIDILQKPDNKVIQPTLDLYNFAKENNVAVFLITGRWENLREATVKNLENAGYKNWDELYLNTDEYHKTHKTIVPFKSSIRKSIIEKGFDIVENIGDQQSDLDGGYSDRTFKLPNPYYLVK